MYRHYVNRGVGLVEVLVALLLLSVAVLGFIALQYRAVDAANEALARTQAMALAKDLNERIRANQFQLSNYAASLATSSASSVNCSSSRPCTSQEFAQADIKTIQDKATALGMQIQMPKCDQDSGTERYCVYVAWAKTQPIDSATDSNACSKNGIYLPMAKCVIMEAYQ